MTRLLLAVISLIVVVSLLRLPYGANGEALSRKRRGGARGERTGAKATHVDNCLICNVKRADVQYKEGYTGERKDYWVCETDADEEPDGKANRIYLLDDLPNEFVKQHKGRLENGRSRICIPNGKANRSNHKVEFQKTTSRGSPKYLGERKEDNKRPEDDRRTNGRRELAKKTIGTHTLLAVIVSSSTTGERDPNTNATILAGNLFGTGPMAQTTSVASQYNACSNGKLQIVPYTSQYVSNGIISVNVPIAIRGTQTLSTIQNAVISATQTALKVTNIRYLANHVLFCLPQGGIIGGSSTWVSYGYTNAVMSFHQYSMCTRLSAPIHETGLNNGFYHSGQGTDEYGDKTGFMGYAYQTTGSPRMCFNAHKNYISGWFDDRKVTINPIVNGAWGGTILAPVDYTAAMGMFPTAVVVVNVGNLYLQLNSAKKYNNETKANPNLVTVVSADVPSNPNIVSRIVASLNAGQSFTTFLTNFGVGGTTSFSLVIEVCSIRFGTIDSAQVSIYLKNGIQSSHCGKIQ